MFEFNRNNHLIGLISRGAFKKPSNPEIGWAPLFQINQQFQQAVFSELKKQTICNDKAV